MMKLALVAKRPKDKAEAHFADSIKNWKLFEKNLKTKAFQKAIYEHPEADEKLKRYVKNYGAYVNSKDEVGKISSRTDFKTYTIKKLPDGRLGCNCKDWQYAKSPKESGDCFHIEELLANSAKQKTSGAAYDLARGAGLALRYHKGMKEDVKGKIAIQNRRNVITGQQLIGIR